ncbi:MAG: DNA-protecting protein DprA [Candidatus Colwellbacteria bacterium]|nr:DNA-protecting protein DprA [Candidatus Colwellbacteria bacterium]
MHEPLPYLLRNISDPPSRLFLRGTLPDESAPTIAIVGTRKASEYGRRLARLFARELALAGATIVSGLAFGIDAEAHEGCLEARGRTVAVLPTHTDEVYPRMHESLARRIVEGGGALVSEYPPGTSAFKDNFLARNRIVSGLSRAVIVIEAPRASGALNTAGHAASQGREVFVAPGPAGSANFEGSHALIRDGARLVGRPDDVIEDLAPLFADARGAPDVPPFAGRALNEFEEKIVEALGMSLEPLSLELLIGTVRLPPQDVMQTLTVLTIEHIVAETDLGYTLAAKTSRRASP